MFAELKYLIHAYPELPFVVLAIGGTANHVQVVRNEIDLDVPVIQVHTPEEVRGRSVLCAVFLDNDLYTDEMRRSLYNVMATAIHAKLGRSVDDLILFRHQAPRWRCKTCNATRNTNPCWKCGVESEHKVSETWHETTAPNFKLIRELGHEVGYAIAWHGSKEDDMDLMAMPWTDDAVSPQELVDHLVTGLRNKNGPARQMPDHLEVRPHGRLSVNINVNGWYKLIDLSIMPRRVLPAEETTRIWEELGGMSQFGKTFGYQQLIERVLGIANA